jgi:hypothetical protein
MKRTFTKLFSTALMLAILFIGLTVKAQTMLASAVTTNKNTVAKKDSTVAAVAATEKKTEVKAAPEDTTWKPVRRLWGYSFGDFYYDGHADQKTGVRGPEGNYNGVPTYRNAFQFRRLYLGYDYEITKKFRAEVLLASEPSANTGVNGTTSIQNGDNLVDNKMSFFIKNFNLRWQGIFPGSDFVIGEMATPGFALNEPGTVGGPTSLSEATWGYRSIEKTVADLHKTNSYDIGASLQGYFDPATKNFGYVAMVGNNSTSSLLSATNANTGFFKIFYGDLYAKFLDKRLVFDIYADYLQTSSSIPATVVAGTTTVNPIGPQSHNMFKIFGAWNTPQFGLGVEAYTQKITNGVTNTSVTPNNPEDVTVNAVSVWVRGAIIKSKLNIFGRYDNYNPSSNFNSSVNYTVNTNFGSYTPLYKEQFYTAGLDYMPAKNIHFMPNFWLTQYQDQRVSTNTKYVADDHTVVYRLTFYYVFGK